MLIILSLMLFVVFILLIREIIDKWSSEYEEKEMIKLEFKILLQDIEDEYEVNGIGHKLFNNIQYQKVKRIICEEEE